MVEKSPNFLVTSPNRHLLFGSLIIGIYIIIVVALKFRKKEKGSTAAPKSPKGESLYLSSKTGLKMTLSRHDGLKITCSPVAIDWILHQDMFLRAPVLWFLSAAFNFHPKDALYLIIEQPSKQLSHLTIPVAALNWFGIPCP